MTFQTAHVPMLTPEGTLPSEYWPSEAQQAFTDAEAAATRAETARDETEVISGLTGEDAAVAFLAADHTTATGAAVRKASADKFGELLPLPVAQDVTLSAEGTYRPIECFDGYFWGCSLTGQLATSTNGTIWTAIGAPAPVRLTGFIVNGAGELVAIAGQKAYKTTGWAANPSTATWAEVAATSPGTATFNRHTFDGHGDKFILAEYSSVNRADSKWVQISLDGGSTWSIVWNTETQFPLTHADSHLHTACYDKWSDRWFFAEGHGVAGVQEGIYYASTPDAIAGNWTRMTGGLADSISPPPTVMVATDDGIVCGTDAPVWAMYGITRTDDPADMALVGTYRWDDSREGVLGFGLRGWRDEETGVVHVPFMSADSDGLPGNPIVAAGTASRAAKVWESPDGGSESRVFQSLVLGETILFMTTTAAAAATKFGRGSVAQVVAASNRDDAGNARGGTALNRPSSLALGLGASTNGWWRSVAVGSRAAAGSGTGGEGVSVGYTSQAVDFGTAVGSNAKATGVAGVVAVGRNSEASGQQSVAVGYASKGTAAQASAFGNGASATGAFGTAIGSGASVTSSTSGTAIGANAATSHAHGVAIGRQTVTTRDFQVAFGPRHLMMQPLATAPLAPGAGNGGLYVADDDGRPGLFFRDDTGVRKVTLT